MLYMTRRRGFVLASTLAMTGAIGMADAADVVRTPLPTGNDFPISLAVTVPAGSDTVYVSGALPQVANKDAPKGSMESFGDMETQTTSVLTQIKGTLEQLGMGMGDIVKMTVFMAADPTKDNKLNFPGLMAGYSKFFGTAEQPNKPARTAVQVAALVAPGALLEIEVIAVKPQLHPKSQSKGKNSGVSAGTDPRRVLAVRHADGRRRCAWCPPADSVYVAYHDDEWGVAVHADRLLFEMLCLEGAQAGLSWSTILNKRATYREAFDHFDAEKMALYDGAKRRRLLSNPGIVRNRLKVDAFIDNARAYLKIRERSGGFAGYIWQFTDGRVQRRRPLYLSGVHASTPTSEAMSKDLKQNGFRFVGSTICYAFMQAVGIVDEHQRYCWAGNR